MSVLNILKKPLRKGRHMIGSWKKPHIPGQLNGDVSWQWRGKSDYGFLVIPHAMSYEKGKMYILNGDGSVRWEKDFDSYPYSFRKICGKDSQVRYAYEQIERPTFGVNAPGSLEETHVVLMDENMNVIRDNIGLLKGGSIRTASFPCENHEYRILDDDHYILTAEKRGLVYNVPGYKGKPVRVFNSIIQEQKNGKVIWQFEARDYPELYEASLLNNDWSSYSGKRLLFSYAADYAHINAVDIAPDGNILVSFRNIGLVMIEKKSKKILWIMGRKHNDIQGMTSDQTGLYQHHVRFLKDGSFTIFDNFGCEEDYSRVCRYWIENNKLIHFKEYRTEHHRSLCMGSAQHLHDDVFLICYGGMDVDRELGYLTADPAFEIYDFSKRESLVSMTFDQKYDCYQVECI